MPYHNIWFLAETVPMVVVAVCAAIAALAVVLKAKVTGMMLVGMVVPVGYFVWLGQRAWPAQLQYVLGAGAIALVIAKLASG